MDNEKIKKLESEITGCKQLLAQTDYQAIKYAEGFISEADYTDIRARRQSLRDKINEAEDILKAEGIEL